MRLGSDKLRVLFLASVLGFCAASPASAQQRHTTGSLERFVPSAAGDAMFGVPSPTVPGHLTPQAKIVADVNVLPLSIQQGSTRSAIVDQQTFLHLAAALPLFDRFLLSVDMPFALTQSGDSPTVAGVPFSSPQSAQVGDLRLGARARIWGNADDPFSLGVGAHVYVPTGPAGSYAAEGAVYVDPHLIVGGRVNRFIYNASVGGTFRASERSHTLDVRAGAALLFGKDFFQLGPEFSLSTPFSKEVLVDNADTRISVASPVSAELMLGAKVRIVPFLVFGVGAGPGLTQGWGTPFFFTVGQLGYEPLPERQKPESDKDGDEIPDSKDACPETKGIKSTDPKKNGCPPDNDGDGITNRDDACVDEPGPKNEDPKKNGCPVDSDGDNIVDPKDACPSEPGPKNADPKKNGCPPDTDGDGISDAKDACVKVPGESNPDPKKHGCPPDTDDDGIVDTKDACPKEPGVPDPDSQKNGCPLVLVTKKEIVILRQIRFRFGQSKVDYTIDPISDDLLTEVRDAIVEHPEIELIEVQGHADNVGSNDFNQALSQGRADAVREWLIKRGIPPEKLVAKGYGTSVPVGTNDTVEGRRANRRVQFMIVKKKTP